MIYDKYRGKNTRPQCVNMPYRIGAGSLLGQCMQGTVVTQWRWDRFVVDRVALGHFCVGLSGTLIELYWTEWHWDIFVVD
jgi:hypothetical protein